MRESSRPVKKQADKSRTTPNPLKQVCIAGLILAVVVAWSMVIYTLFWGRDPGLNTGSGGSSFARELHDYDLLDPIGRGNENQELLERRLSQLQKQARGAEDELSVIKRYRLLALRDRRFIPAYAKAAKEAANKYAYSLPLAAAAAEAVLLENTPSREAAALLDAYARRVSQNSFAALELSLHILAGNLDDPARAAEVPGILNLLRSDSLPVELQIDEFLLLAHRNETASAQARFNVLRASSPSPTPPRMLRMGAEFFYDHNSPLRAAELFLALGGEEDIARAADALAMAGELPGARNIAIALASPSGPEDASIPPRSLSRILYNLSATSADDAEERYWLQKLFSARSQQRRSIGEQSALDITEIYGTLRYSRLLDTQESIAILDEDRIKQNPLLDLELLRRRMETLPPTRAAAEVWLILGRHSSSEALCEWAAWYFDHQKLYDDTERLLKEAERKGMSGSWIDLHRSLAFLREGKIAEGEKILKERYTYNSSLMNSSLGT